MSAGDIIRAAPTQPAKPWARHVLDPLQWQAMAASLPAEPALALLGLWVDRDRVHALFLDEAARAVLPVSCPLEKRAYTALSPARPAAAWFERIARDLWGCDAAGGIDERPWLDHGVWGLAAPMAVRPTPTGGPPPPYEFLTADGHDLHQIAVGPVHAGIIEPGHFRFIAQGETIVRLEVRLGYAHKGTLGLLRGKSPRAAARFAARVSGDATVAHGIAFARAAEAALDTPAPPRADCLRAVMAELERIANHLGDAGAICNDAAVALLHARFGWHREAVLRASAIAFGHRLMMDCVVPGGVAGDMTPGGAEAILRAVSAVTGELPALLATIEGLASLTDRLVGTGVLDPALAVGFAAGGPVGRACGRASDARAWPGYPPYTDLGVVVPVLQAGDVDARLRVRLSEIAESARLLHALLEIMPEGAILTPLPSGTGEGLAVAESCRGDVWHWLRIEGGLIAGAFIRDPSLLHWPLLQAAVQSNIVADFPLCNKSFNASYSGADL